MTEHQLLELCINGMAPVYRALLENPRFHTFFELHEAAKRLAITAPALLEGIRPAKNEDTCEIRGNRRLIKK